MLVDHNSLSGYLPASYGNLRQLRALSVGETTPVCHVKSAPVPLYCSFTMCDSDAQFCGVFKVYADIVGAGNTAIVGPLPPSWANMTRLQSLDVSDNCGICGDLPTFPPSVLASLKVDSQGSGLGTTCNRNSCSAFPISILAQAGALLALLSRLYILP